KTTLGVGDIVDVTLQVTNTSQTTPPDPFRFLGATLTTGTTFVLEACQDSGCSQELAGTLMFVDGGGGNGCVSSVAGVASCAEDISDSNKVNIAIGAGGVSLPPATSGSLTLATIRLQAVTPVSVSGGFFLRASTAANQINATISRCCNSIVTSC